MPRWTEREQESLYLIFFKHFRLFETLHRVNLARVDFLHESYFSERALADDFDGAEVVEAEPRAPEPQKARLCAAELLQLPDLAVVRHCLVGSDPFLEVGAP